MELNNNNILGNEVKHLREDDVIFIVTKYFAHVNFQVESYSTNNASDKMLGFLADYWKLKVNVVLNNKERRVLSFFIKAVSRSNPAKAAMVNELKLFDKEAHFYSIIKKNIEVSCLKAWSPKLAAVIKDAIVFEDINAQNYKVRDKFLRFDRNHTEQALQAVARFHASSIIYEKRKSKDLQRQYKMNDDYEEYQDTAGYNASDTWFVQCMNGALEAVKTFSKYSKDKENIKLIERKWKSIWAEALEVELYSDVYKLICHRDLWNNNVLFHYDENRQADDCLMVDFQAVSYQPPSADVMLLLYCNLDPKTREQYLEYFLDFYYQELKAILGRNDIHLEDVITMKDFLDSAEKQRKWGLIVYACLLPQIWVNDDLTTQMFCDSSQFDDILSKNKGAFIKRMIMKYSDYKNKIMEIFDEIVERYCLQCH